MVNKLWKLIKRAISKREYEVQKANGEIDGVYG